MSLSHWNAWPYFSLDFPSGQELSHTPAVIEYSKDLVSKKEMRGRTRFNEPVSPHKTRSQADVFEDRASRTSTAACCGAVVASPRCVDHHTARPSHEKSLPREKTAIFLGREGAGRPEISPIPRTHELRYGGSYTLRVLKTLNSNPKSHDQTLNPES